MRSPVAALSLFTLVLPLLGPDTAWTAPRPAWTSPHQFRLVLQVDPGRMDRSRSPATLKVEFGRSFQSTNDVFDPHTIEVLALNHAGQPITANPHRTGHDALLWPWWLERLYGTSQATLHLVLPDSTATNVVVYFDTHASGLGRPDRYPGLVGDGDFFRESRQRREIGAHHFGCFADLDQDGDLDLFQGGVEPFIHVWEHTGGNRYEERGRLASGGKLFTLPHNPNNHRSWVVPHFHDLDQDGDLDFLPSFMDGPHAGKVVWFENVTPKKGPITFADRSALRTVSGVPIAGGDQAGGWFPSIVLVRDFDHDGDGREDLILGNNNHAYLYRNLGPDPNGGWRWADAATLPAGGEDIELFNPCFDVADIDGDGDWDLFAAPQSGPIQYFENVDETESKTRPTFAKGIVIAHDERYLQRSTHPRVKVADFTGDGRLDLVVDRAWELTNLDRPEWREFGALFLNEGSPARPKWKRAGHEQGAPYTEAFQPCDAIRQNVVRAFDWDHDGRTDLLAGDCDGFVWWFRNRTDALAPVFANGQKLLADGQTLSTADGAGHARPDVTDWNSDGLPDVVLSDGAGQVFVCLNQGTLQAPRLSAKIAVKYRNPSGDMSPIKQGTRSHILVCDWNRDGRKDLVMSDQNNPGFRVFLNEGTEADPVLGAARQIPLDTYMRPNLGSFVDWDGDGRMDFIGCEFEHSIRLYRNVGGGEAGDEPRFANRKGQEILRPWSIMMISGADAVDWNGDGDLDLLTGQGHGGSGLRFYERDYLEDLKDGTFPAVKVVAVEEKER